MKRSFPVRQVVFHPSTLAAFSGLIGALIGYLVNLVSGGNSSQIVWIALVFAILFSLAITAWQMFSQERSGQQLMTLLQEMAFQTYFLTALADRPEVSQIAQRRLSQILKNLNSEQQISMLRFFSDNHLPTTFIGEALQKSTSLQGADLHQIVLPQIHLEQAYLFRANLSEADLSEAHLQEAYLLKANLYRANLCQSHLDRATLHGTNLRGANLTEANLTEANLTEADMGVERPTSGKAQIQKDPPGPPTNLTNATLAQALLLKANLSGANLNGANLRGAILKEANLRGADLTNADLTEAVCIETDFRGANVTQEQLMTIISSTDMRIS